MYVYIYSNFKHDLLFYTLPVHLNDKNEISSGKYKSQLTIYPLILYFADYV